MYASCGGKKHRMSGDRVMICTQRGNQWAGGAGGWAGTEAHKQAPGGQGTRFTLKHPVPSSTRDSATNTLKTTICA